MDNAMFLIFLVGVVTFTVVWMPFLAKKTGISYSVYYLVTGIVLYKLFPEHLPNPLPQENETAALHLTELIVIISLMGAGIRINRPFSFGTWRLPLRLVFIAMLLCIAAAAALGYYYLGLNLAAALLLGAVLAPTDPVLATEVQVGPPNEQVNYFHKFALTTEAGINDGLAFPFTWLAVTISLLAAGEDTSILHWFSFHVAYQIIAGVILGYFLGKATGYLVFDFSRQFKFLEDLDGFLAISLTLLVYGLTELLHGYGFIAVFIAAITFRHSEKKHEYHATMHSFTNQIERLLTAILTVLFGGAIVMGIFDILTWQMVIFALLFVLVVRPVFGYLSLVGTDLQPKERFGICFFGIRGMGSFFYLAFAFGETSFMAEEELWSVVAFTVALSTVLHGMTAAPAMNHLKRVVPKPEK
jgi:NhaP-type Na+/H+ or K+/H+ antiporter